MFTIIFDVGNVIVSYDHDKVLEQLASISNLSLDEVNNKLALNDSDLLVRFRHGKITEDEFFSELKSLLNSDLDLAEFKKIWTSTFSKREDVESWIESDILTYAQSIILTDTNISHFEFIKNNFPIINKFNKIYTSYETGLTKKTTEIFEKIISENNIDKSKCIFIDDTESNVEVARKAGIPSMHFKRETFKKDFEELLISLKPIPQMNKYAGSILIDEENNLILSKRISTALVNPNRVALFGGRVENGEEPNEGLSRELKEELDLNIEPKDLNYLATLYKFEERLTLPHLERITECSIFYVSVNSKDLGEITDESSDEFVKIKSVSDLENLDLTKITEQSVKIFFGTVNL